MDVTTPDAAVHARGVIFVHSCPRSQSAHLEWAVAGVLDRPVRLGWSTQPVVPTTVRAELTWRDAPGTGARLVGALLAFRDVRFEVTEEPSVGREGERYSSTPTLGLYRATVGPHGDIVVGEDRLRAAVRASAGAGPALTAEIEGLLGVAWDAELEAFRCAGEGTTVRLLHRTG